MLMKIEVEASVDCAKCSESEFYDDTDVRDFEDFLQRATKTITDAGWQHDYSTAKWLCPEHATEK